MLAVSDPVLQACISFFEVFQTDKRGAFLFCLVHMKVPLLP